MILKFLLKVGAAIAFIVGMTWAGMNTDLLSKDGPLFGWQTLIGAALALIAAYVAVRPVWRQVILTSVQAQTAYREFLRDRLRTIEEQRKRLMPPLGAYLEQVSSRIDEVEEYGQGSLDANWAFGSQQLANQQIDRLKAFRAREDGVGEIESAVDGAVCGLETLADALDDIHQPESTDQIGEDWAFTDEEWAAIREKANTATETVSGLASAARTAVKALDNSFADEGARLRTLIRRTEKALLKTCL